MEPSEGIGGRSFVEVMSEKYSPENFPYRRGPGMGVVVVVPTAAPQGSPMKGKLRINLNFNMHRGSIKIYRSERVCLYAHKSFCSDFQVYQLIN